MAAKQGYRQLLAGRKKRLTNSEVARGYLYITNDRLAIEKLGRLFDVIFDKHVFKDRHIDGFGRVSVGRELLQGYKGRTLIIQIEGQSITIKPLK